ncbi:MAG TPA: serine/threonine-protein kinase [Planctomycetota bacterium]
MGQAPSSLVGRLPITLKSGTAVLESYIGTGGMAHVFQARLENLPALIAELILAGESDPAVFGLDIPFRYGQGHLAKEEHVKAIRERAARLWEEFRQSPARAELQQKYLRVIDGRLLKNTAVAVKVLRSEGLDRDEAARCAARFAREDHALRKLNHKNIIRRYACLQDPELGPCLFLERVEGRTLDEVLKRQRDKNLGPLPLAAVAHFAYQLAHALSHAHQHGVVHGDVKPQNILSEKASAEEVAQKKAQGAVKLLDFGLSRPVGAEPPPRVEGTIPFVAPEQLRRQAPSPATDVYQFATTLFALVTGRPPYEGYSPEEFRESILKPDPHPSRLHHLRPDISPRFEAVIEGARDKDPDKRWTLAKVLEEIAQIYAGREFTVEASRKAHIAEELLTRAQTNGAINDWFRAIEALDLAGGFLEAVPKDKSDDVRARYEKLVAQFGPQKEAVETLKRIQRDHILPVDHLMGELYDRYGKGKPLLNEDEKGVIREESDGQETILKRSLIDGILGHTHAAIEELAKIDPELVGDIHRKLVDRASSQEVAATDLITREIQFGQDYRRTS